MPVGPLDTWRTATSVLPRRTALRLLGASAFTAALAACSGSGGLGAVALGKFAAGTWNVSTPGAHWTTVTLTITESGTWKGHFADIQDQQEQSSPQDSSGTWALSGQTLTITIDNPQATDDPDVSGATAASVPATVSGDASAHLTWTYGSRLSDVQAKYNGKTRTLTLISTQGHRPQTITAVRA
ncbi:hypothetical protein [Kitasatospora sp. LaBMicrA B282]|uniref:hypothetical protein n=1 Tax=Kitasatospora sp. LaBMicrA B282 TaxID=3420949 RepID=UPI003D13EF1F